MKRWLVNPRATGVALAASIGVLVGRAAASSQATAASSGTSGTGVRETFRLLDLPETWIVVLLVIPACLLIAWLGYAREGLPARARALLTALRLAALLLLCAIVFRPVFVQRREEVRQAEVVILADDSASLRRKDAYSGDERARELLGALAGTPAADTMRFELERAALDKVLLPRLKDGGYAARLYRFGDTAEPMPDTSALSGRGHATHLGDVLQSALAAHRGRYVTDIVILSDGRSNGGLPPIEAARAAAAAGIPVHTLVVGDTRPEKNLLVELIEAPTSVLDGDEIAVSVRVLTRGIPGQQRARVELVELRQDAAAGEQPVAEEELDVDEKGTRAVLVAAAGTSEARPSERRFRVRVPPIQDETLKDDNSIEFSVRITPEKIRVLYVDGYPRYEYRFLKELLKRSDQNIDVQVFLLSATPDFVQESTKGTPPLASVPTGRKELLQNYDVVILGDVNPYAISPDPARCEEFQASLREFVERGGGLVFVAGEYDDPRAYVGTALEELLPVVVDGTGALQFEGDTTKEFRPVLEDPANPSEVVRLVSDARQNRALWEEPGGYYGAYWFYPVVRAKPASQVLLRHPTAKNQHGRFPLLVSGYFPSGRTLYLSWDETWRWRYRFADRYHERFWRNAIRWVALGRLKSGDRRVQIDALKSNYDLDERVTIEARVLDEDFRPSERPTQAARLEHPDGSATELSLGLVPERPGLYRAAFDVERPGLYAAFVENEGARVASTDFEVVLPSRENADPSPDPLLMQSIAAQTGGRALDLAHVRDLAREFPGNEEHREPISSELEDAWDHWGTLLLVLALLSAEWILRKRWELI